MKPSSDDPNIFFQRPDAVAVVVDGARLFGLLSRSYAVPHGVVALAYHGDGTSAMRRAGETISSDDCDRVLFARTTPITLDFDGLSAASIDHYRCVAEVRLSVSVISDPPELRSFGATALGGRQSLDQLALHGFFAPHVATALERMTEGRGAEVLIAASSAEALAGEVAEGLKSVAFASGVAVNAPISLRIDSSVYRQVRRSRAESEQRRGALASRERIERALTAARRERSEELTGLLAALKKQACDTPGLELVDLLRTVPDSDRGRLYQLFIETTDVPVATGSIVVGSGDELLFYAAEDPGDPSHRRTIPGTVGPVRSVQVSLNAGGERHLLVGASRGVYELDVSGSGDVATYRCGSNRDVKGGVNSVAVAGDHIFATHSELGLLRWKRGADEAADGLQCELTRSARAVRCVSFFRGDIYFSADNFVYKMPADECDVDPVRFTGSGAIITAVCMDADHVYAGNADGEILCWEHDGPDLPTLIHRGRQRAAKSVWAIDVAGVRRLYFTDTSVAVHACVIGDTVTTRYEAGGQTLDSVEVAPDLIVATNETRDRLICWSPARPAEPSAVIHVARLTGRSVQDACLISAV